MQEDTRFTVRVLGTGLVILIIVVSVFTLSKIPAMIENENKLDIAISEDYTFYLDGQEVDIDTINPKSYKYEVREDEHTVILSHKRNIRRNYIPVFVPSVF